MSHAGLASLLPLPVAIPITGAVLAPLAARVSRRLPLIVSLVAMAGATALLGLIAPTVYRGVILTHFMGHWLPVAGRSLGIAFAADGFGMTYALAVGLIGAVLLVYTLSQMSGLAARELGGYACLFQLLLAALIASALTGDLFNLFVWFEVAALASYGLTGFFLERPVALEAAFKILVLTTIASFGIFLAAALIYSGHGALNFGQIHNAVHSSARTADLVALGLLVTGFATKAGLIPFHGWLPDAHTAAPSSVSALFSGLMVNLGVFAIARLALQVYTPTGGRPVLGLLTVVGATSAVLGAVLALAQDDFKRLLAYDTVSQMGVLAVGFGTGAASGIGGAVYHLLNHALFKALMFLVAGAIVHATGLGKLSELGGLWRRRPVLAVMFVVAVMSIAGIPPLNGYVSLGLIHDDLLSHQPGLYAVLLIAQIVTIAALARATYLAFFRTRDRDYERFDRLHPGMVLAMAVLAAACIGFGVFPFPVLQHVVSPATSSLLSPTTYARAALSSHGGTVSLLHLSFSYGSASDLGAMAGTVLAGLALAAWYIRGREPRPISWLRAAHTGSVNDYAAYLAVGTVGTVIALVAVGG
jgi:multicomponent Na+:H+ antiporter subunit D